MKQTTIKKIICILATAALLFVYGAFAMASTSDSSSGGDQGTAAVGDADKGDQNNSQTKDTAAKEEKDPTKLGDCSIEIMSSRMAKDFEKKPVIIVKYKYTNNSDTARSFMVAVEASAYQDGVGLNETFFVEDSANYSSDNQMKELKKGASIEVEVAYVLNDTETDVLVEVEEFLSFSDAKITKTFSLK